MPLSSLNISVSWYKSCCFPATAFFSASTALSTAASPWPWTDATFKVLLPKVSVVPETSPTSPTVKSVPGIKESILITPFNTSVISVLASLLVVSTV